LGDQLPSTKMTTQDVLDYGQAHGIVVKCPYCKSSTWDNRTSKTNSKSPDFRCKSKACGAAAWERETGQLKWVPGGEKK
jgi:transposase-like protein